MLQIKSEYESFLTRFIKKKKKKKGKLKRSVQCFKGNDFLKIYPQDQTTKTVSE